MLKYPLACPNSYLLWCRLKSEKPNSQMPNRITEPFCLRAEPAGNGDFANSIRVRAKFLRYDSIAAAFGMGRAVLTSGKKATIRVTILEGTSSLCGGTFTANVRAKPVGGAKVCRMRSDDAHLACGAVDSPRAARHVASIIASDPATQNHRRDRWKKIWRFPKQHLRTRYSPGDCPCSADLHVHRIFGCEPASKTSRRTIQATSRDGDPCASCRPEFGPFGCAIRGFARRRSDGSRGQTGSV